MIGTVARFLDRRGFGFITPADGGPDVYVHFTALPEMGRGLRTLTVGERVEFETEPDPRRGTPRAKNVRRVGAAETGGVRR